MFKLFKKYKLIELFPRAMFWDVDPEKLSIRKNKSFIIQRVLSRNMEREEYMENLEKLYSIEDIKHFALISHQIFGNENIDFIAKLYDMNPRDFPKYILDFSKYA